MFLPMLLAFVPAAAPPVDPAEHFETRVRPALVEHCGKCHTGEKAKAGFRVDQRAALLEGGDSGVGVVPGDASAGTFLDAIRYDNPDRAMPPKGKLPAAVIHDLEAWVAAGAVWPDAPAAARPEKSAFDLAGRKAAHWAWQPITPQPVPPVQNSAWPRDPVDAFILARLEANQLTPALPAPALVWLRRVTFALTGLPPTPAEQTAFLADSSPAGRAAVVAQLLASPHFGERWGRHWLDLVRYAESRGHEFDVTIPNSFQYRDYVVRALNADVPYDEFLREHLAGDLLPNPRRDPVTGANEASIGTAFWHLGEEVHSPVDIRQDQADRLDNRLDVFGKLTLGLTVACARCHDHKFDAISAADYAALYGVLQPGAIRQTRIDGWQENRAVAAELALARQKAVADGPIEIPKDDALSAWLELAAALPLESADDVGLVQRAAGELSLATDGHATREPYSAWVLERFWDQLAVAPGTQAEPYKPLAARPAAGFTVRTATVPITKPTLYALVRGGGTVYAAVCGHSQVNGPLHQQLVQTLPDEANYRWVTVDVSAYQNLPVHVEFTATPGTPFAVAAVVLADTAPPPPPPAHPAAAEFPLPADRRHEYRAAVATLKRRAVWQSRLAPTMFDGTGFDEVVFLRGSPKARGPVTPRRSLEALTGSAGFANSTGSGRAELAQQLTDPTRNPLLARVAVNRIWHQLFGRGLVATPDNFGRLGEPPTHPELLDTLAADFIQHKFSQKQLIRRLVLSATFAQDSRAEPLSERDPDNQLLSRFRLKRLEGEAIRDAMLSASGRLDVTVGGPPIPIHLTAFLTGRGRPETSGPLDGAGRRSLYLAVRRNFLHPFLAAFDTPVPATTVGRRNVSNVPAQALILLNDPFVHNLAAHWGQTLVSSKSSVPDRIQEIFAQALGRPATDAENTACQKMLADTPEGWSELIHAVFTMPEFIFIR